MQLSTAIRAAMANAAESVVGVSPVLKIYTGPAPANPAAAATGTVLASMTLPSDWLTDPGDGTKALSGTWHDTSAANSGIPGYFRIWDSTVTTCGHQGSVGLPGAGCDLSIDTGSVLYITASSVVTATAYGITIGNS